MNSMIRFIALLLCMVTLLWGCHRTTTVILPPETAATMASDGDSKVPSVSGTVPPTDPATEPVTMPATAPPDEPTVNPGTEPTAAPTTEPTAAPTTEPITEPSTAPTTEPVTVPSTEPTAEPTTEPATHPIYDLSGHSIGSLEYGLLEAINQQRAAAEEPLPPLTLDATLCALAAIRAYECTESFSHSRPDGRGAFTVLSDYGYYIWSNLSERIHYGSSGLSSGTVVKGWMYNADYSADILSGDFTHIGIGIYDNGGTTYIVCFFAG